MRKSAWIVSPGSLQAYAVAVIFISIATIARWILGFAVHQPLPFITFYPAVVFVTLIGGATVGVLAIVAGAVLAWWLFMPHEGGVFPSDLSSQATLGTYFVAALAMAWAADYTRRLARSLREEESLRTLAVQELSHRLKNKIMTIQAIVAMRLQDYPEIRNDIQGALTALASADELLTASQAKGADLREILCAELKPYTAKRVTLSGPDVYLRSQLALMMALLIHELATNAAKYGAFSTPQGRVLVEWSFDAGRLELVWRESGGPAITRPVSHGFGTRLFSRALTPFGGTAHADFAADGLVCKLSVPMAGNS